MINFDKLIPHTEAEVKQQMKLDRIRQCEEMRKKRFFNAKNRLIGKDNVALAKQIAERKLRENLEKENDKALFEKMISDIELANNIEKLSDDMRKKIAYDIDIYRLNEQLPNNRREFDLNDPKIISHQLPMRLENMSITDPRELTKMSFLNFTSEDENGGKAKALKKHLWQCLAQQISENYVNRKNAEMARIQNGKDTIILDSIVNKLLDNEMKFKANKAKTTMEYNKRKAEYEMEKKILEKRKHDEDGIAHIATCLNSSFYTENRDVAKSSIGLNKIIPHLYKGMTEEDIREIKETQLKQIEEIEDRKKLEKVTEKYWMDVEDLQSNVRYVWHTLEEGKRKEVNKVILDENVRLAAEQAIQRELMKKMATDNFPTNEYFDAFNSTTR